MKLSQLLSYVRRAVDDYQMIQDGDRIAVGVSGGKDSLCLLVALAHLRRFYPKRFELCAITVSLGFEGMDFQPIADLCSRLEVPYYIAETDIGEIVFDTRKESNPCSLCAKMRKGALNDKAVSLGYRKIALGHNKEDVIETFFLSLFYEGRLHSFAPVVYMDRKDVHTIRPLVYAPEKDLIAFATAQNLGIVENKCTVDGHTKRTKMRQMMAEWNEEFDNIEEKVFGAIRRAGLNGWAKAEDSVDV